MAEKIRKALIEALISPERGNRVVYDTDVKGFGIRITAAGTKSFVLNYRTRLGREHRYTIGRYPDWTADAAREEAKALKRRIGQGEDPMGELQESRDAKTVADLCDRFEAQHLPKLRPATRRDYEALIRREIRPALKHKRVFEVTFADIDDMHRKVSKRAPYVANRVVAVLSKMFALAIKWQWRADNPAKGIERNPEDKRHRYLSPAELTKLTAALASLGDQQAANIIRMLLLTGARRGEVQAAKWADLDLTAGIWTKPGSTTKQKTIHRVPLSTPARQLLFDIRTSLPDDAVYVFPSAQGHRVEIKSEWRQACIAAGIIEPDGDGVRPSARIHDLRHTYASMLASAGLSLPIIGALLGHTQPATTARYSHLMDDPLRKATDKVGAILTLHGGSAEITQLKGGAA